MDAWQAYAGRRVDRQPAVRYGVRQHHREHPVHLPYAGRCQLDSGKPALHLRMCDVTQPHASPARPYVPCDDPLVALRVVGRGRPESSASRQPNRRPWDSPAADRRTSRAACLPRSRLRNDQRQPCGQTSWFAAGRRECDSGIPTCPAVPNPLLSAGHPHLASLAQQPQHRSTG